MSHVRYFFFVSLAIFLISSSAKAMEISEPKKAVRNLLSNNGHNNSGLDEFGYFLSTGNLPGAFTPSKDSSIGPNVGKFTKTIGFYETLKPMRFVDKNGQVANFAKRLIKEVFSEWISLEGITITYDLNEFSVGAILIPPTYSVQLENITRVQAEELIKKSGWGKVLSAQ